ncbi:hypothetical protein MOQ72_33605 [Saccharopolyspora sp. K220]|nr:hypothetical protein [Saccharopolyspora soli]
MPEIWQAGARAVHVVTWNYARSEVVRDRIVDARIPLAGEDPVGVAVIQHDHSRSRQRCLHRPSPAYGVVGSCVA